MSKELDEARARREAAQAALVAAKEEAREASTAVWAALSPGEREASLAAYHEEKASRDELAFSTGKFRCRVDLELKVDVPRPEEGFDPQETWHDAVVAAIHEGAEYGPETVINEVEVEPIERFSYEPKPEPVA